MSERPAADWYPDPTDPRWLRYWDGEGWTDQRRPAAPALAAPGPVLPQRRKRPVWVTVLLVVGAIVVVWVGVATISNTFFSKGGPIGARYTCQDLASESVRISAEQNTGTIRPLLIKVRDLSVVSDKQSTASKPASGTVTLLTCRGTGVFSGWPDTAVTITLTLDSDGDQFVTYEAS